MTIAGMARSYVGNFGDILLIAVMQIAQVVL